MAVAQKKNCGYTYSDYLTWPEEGRMELIEGEIFDMSPAPSRRHQQVSGELFRQIANHLVERGCSVYPAPFDVRLAEAGQAEEDETSVVQPDVSVIRDPGKLDDRGCRGAPDFIAEVVRPATASKDYIQKRILYERHGVREYWLVHPVDRMVIIHLSGEDGRFSSPSFHPGEGALNLSVLPDTAIDLDRVFAE